MSVKVENTENKNEVKLSFTIEAAKFDEAMKKVYVKTAKKSILLTDYFPLYFHYNFLFRMPS